MSLDKVDDRFVMAMVNSYERWTGASMLDEARRAKLAEEPGLLSELLWHAEFGLVAHGTESDPIFCYANQHALTLFDYNQAEFYQLPSRYSAEIDNRAERAALLKQVEQFGYAHGYSGVRITKDGRRFMIEDATVWNVMDTQQRLLGQAALIRGYHWLT